MAPNSVKPAPLTLVAGTLKHYPLAHQAFFCTIRLLCEEGYVKEHLRVEGGLVEVDHLGVLVEDEVRQLHRVGLPIPLQQVGVLVVWIQVGTSRAVAQPIPLVEPPEGVPWHGHIVEQLDLYTALPQCEMGPPSEALLAQENLLQF